MENLPWAPITYGVTNIAVFAWFLIKLHFRSQAQQDQIDNLKAENKEMREMLKELNDTLLIVKNNTDLLLLGRIKTNSR